MKHIILALLALVPITVWADTPLTDAGAAAPPVAKQKSHARTIHGETLPDPFFWLREKGTADVTAHLEAENAYTAAATRSLEPFADKLYGEILSRVKQTDLDVPHRRGTYYYCSRTVEGQQYPIHCRKHGNLDAPEEVLLDGNEMAKGNAFFQIGPREVSDDGLLLAYATDTTGFREYVLSVKDLASGQTRDDRLSKIQSFAWAADNQTLFYVAEDHAKRGYRLYRHVLGQPQAQDELVYEEQDELYDLSVWRTRDRKYLIAESESSETTESRYVAADKPTAPWSVVLPREFDHEYSLDHRDGLFYMVTNKGAKNYRYVTAPVSDPSPQNWKELLPHRPDVLVSGAAVFANHACVLESENAVPHVRIIDLATGQDHRIQFSEAFYAVIFEHNHEFKTSSVRILYTSFATPFSVYDYDLDQRQLKLLKRTEVPGGHDPEQYQTERLSATATDGTKVPISLVYKRGVQRDGSAPLLLYGYGSYGFSMPVVFMPDRLPLLDRGVIYALAHIRGGKDLGERWHEEGKLQNKRNTFTDFIACADHLVTEKYTSRERLAIQGASAGGLLIGAVLNERPNLCRAAVLEVPFVDVINTMLDPSLPLTVPEYLEWGNPNVKDQYDYMKSYCPYTNLAAKNYPAILVKTSLNDSQVMYWEPAKYVAKLRTLKTDKNPLLFKCIMAAGHSGQSGRYDQYRERAFVLAFILDQIGVRQ